MAVETSRGGDEFVFRKVVTLGAPLKKAAGKPRLVFKEVGGLHFLEKVVPSSGKVQEVL